MAAVRHSPIALRQWLVRLGHLSFDDFRFLGPQTLLSQFTLQNSLLSDWSLALNNAPHISRHFRLQIADCRFPDLSLVTHHSSIDDIHAAQQRLVTHFAYDLLRAKAPPLYDALPWHDWDFSTVAKRFPLWKTRFLLAGDGTTVTMCRCRKSAGVYALEPDDAIARYTERKAEVEKIRRFHLIGAGHRRGGDMTQLSSIGIVSQAATLSRSSVLKLWEIALPDNSVDLAIIGSIPALETGNWKLAIHELLRVAANVLIVENNPLAPTLDEKVLAASGFQPASVEVRGLGSRRCWSISRT